VIPEFYKSVDLLLVVGCRLRGHETGEFGLKLPENIIQIDSDPMADGRTYAATIVCGDAAATLQAMLPRIEGRLKVDPGIRPSSAR